MGGVRGIGWEGERVGGVKGKRVGGNAVLGKGMEGKKKIVRGGEYKEKRERAKMNNV